MNLEFVCEYLAPKDISRRDVFFFSCHRVQQVHRILDLTGRILTPLWVKQEGKRFVLVDGYARWAWVKSKGMKVPCIIFPEDSHDCNMLIWKIFDLISRREPDIIEKARIVRNLASFFTPEEIKRRFFPLLNISHKPRMFKTLLLVAMLPHEEVEKFIVGVVSDKVLFKIVWWDEGSRKAFIRFLDRLRCSVSIQREILDFVEDISRLGGIQPCDIILNPEVEEILQNERITPRDKAERIRSLLRKKVYPMLTRREQHVVGCMSKIALPRGINIRYPEFFEGDVWHMTLSFTNIEELKNQLESVARPQVIVALKNAMEGPDGSEVTE